MTGNSQPSTLSQGQRLLLLITAFGLAVVLFLLRGGFNSEAPLDLLARRSLEPDTALTNGRPTVIEFYADWCQACREMAPAMLATERDNKGQLDLVLVNVDNTRWQDLIELYDVNGIPQLNFFDNNGNLQGLSLGARTEEQLQQLTYALIKNQPLPTFTGVGAISSLTSTEPAENSLSNSKAINPMTHG